MIKKIIHIGDVHIRNIKRHDEYTEQFIKFIDSCKEFASEYEYNEVRIVIAGDLFHQKIQTSNEQTSLLSWLLRELQKVCPIVIVAGNHDFMESNSDRLDSITPIIKLMGLENVQYLDMNTNYKSNCVVDDNIVWCLYSIFDNYKKPDISIERVNHPDKKFIGLFHGAITGAKTDINFEFEHGISTDIFDDCDVVMCGDIHKRQELDRNGIKIVYPGSLIQQDKGEAVSSHGFLIWDVETMEYEEHDLPNEYGFYKLGSLRYHSENRFTKNNQSKSK
jgi:DNA repair exonuclease SbcCD nuclease subunit